MKTLILASLLALTAVSGTVITTDPAAAGCPGFCRPRGDDRLGLNSGKQTGLNATRVQAGQRARTNIAESR
jgi:hypothetical protein